MGHSVHTVKSTLVHAVQYFFYHLLYFKWCLNTEKPTFSSKISVITVNIINILDYVRENLIFFRIFTLFFPRDLGLVTLDIMNKWHHHSRSGLTPGHNEWVEHCLLDSIRFLRFSEELCVPLLKKVQRDHSAGAFIKLWCSARAVRRNSFFLNANDFPSIISLDVWIFFIKGTVQQEKKVKGKDFSCHLRLPLSMEHWKW